VTTPYRLAATAEVALRELNHATFPGKSGEGWEYVGDVYDVAGSLAMAVHHLIQTTQQLAAFLERERAAGRVLSREVDADAMLRCALTGLRTAEGHAHQVTQGLREVQVATSGLYAPDPVSEVEACGCGGQGCDTCSGTYVMIVPGQSVSDGDHDEHQEQADPRPADQI
jgi:hypothetical protein